MQWQGENQNTIAKIMVYAFIFLSNCIAVKKRYDKPVTRTAETGSDAIFNFQLHLIEVSLENCSAC